MQRNGYGGVLQSQRPHTANGGRPPLMAACPLLLMWVDVYLLNYLA
jgi:hypothetical protein